MHEKLYKDKQDWLKQDWLIPNNISTMIDCPKILLTGHFSGLTVSFFYPLLKFANSEFKKLKCGILPSGSSPKIKALNKSASDVSGVAGIFAGGRG